MRLPSGVGIWLSDRRTGELTHMHKNRTHPFQVELMIPGSHLRNAIHIMYRWATRYGHEATRLSEPGRREIRLMRWCYAVGRWRTLSRLTWEGGASTCRSTLIAERR